MENTEKPSNQPRPAESAPVSTLMYSEPVNKPNPNMVMAVALCFMLIIGLGIAVYKGADEPQAEVLTTEELEKQKYREMIAAERALSSTDGRASAAAFETRVANILDNTHALQTDFEAMKAGYKQATDDLQTANNKEQGYQNTIATLSSANSNLKNEITQLRALAANAQSLQQQVDNLSNELNNLRGRPTNESLQALRQKLDSEQITNGELSRQIAELEAKLRNMVDSSELTQQSQNLVRLTRENEELRRQLQALQTDVDFAKLFVSSSDTLPVYAQALYNELKILEGSSESELNQSYARINKDLNAYNLQQVRFATGSSSLNFQDQTLVKSKVDTTSPGDYFLVVGYASKTGDAQSNQKLSARRATAVASIVNQLKKSGQEVRAVYLGQTDRFSRSVNAENQLCEVWRIRK